VPHIVTGQYTPGRNPAHTVGCFAASVIAAAYVTARVRLASGSVWPAAVFHATWNAEIQGSFDRFTESGTAALWTGESGILVALTSLLLAALLALRPLTVRLSPSTEWGTPRRLITM
jgi:hypothetical protein